MAYTFNQLREALLECTSFDLELRMDDLDEPGYALLDGCGDQDGDLFYDLDDVTDYVTNNEQVADYLAALA